MIFGARMNILFITKVKISYGHIDAHEDSKCSLMSLIDQCRIQVTIMWVVATGKHSYHEQNSSTRY